MTPRKQKQQNGFTIIELLVVISIMAIMATLLLANYAGTRDSRNAAIAQSQLVTNIRKAQTDLISGRVVNNVGIRYYAMQFNVNATSYTIDTINDQYSTAVTSTINLPANIGLLHLQTQTGNSITTTNGCTWLIFASPFSAVYIWSQPDVASCSTGLTILATSLQNPSFLLQQKDKKLYLTMKAISNTTVKKTVLVNGTSDNVISDSTEPADQ